MLLSDYLRTRGQQLSVFTGQATELQPQKQAQLQENPQVNDNGDTFAQALDREIGKKSGVEFSGHALRRIESRSIDVFGSDKLARLNKGVEIAAQKGSNDALVLIDSTAFVVSVKNNRVITTMSSEDLIGNVFTNIDSTVIM